MSDGQTAQLHHNPLHCASSENCQMHNRKKESNSHIATTPHEECDGLVRQTFPGERVFRVSPREKMSAAVLMVLAAVDPSAFASSGAT